jgi:hypothetical protein
MPPTRDDLVARLLDGWGTTYASEAGIPLRGGASSLFQLLCLSLLLSARIRSNIAVDAMRALRDAGWRTPKAMTDATWKQRTDVLNRSGYARYDESTSRMLAATAELVTDVYHGDLRQLRAAADGDTREARRRLKEFKGIGDVGADIFLREAQGEWPEYQPFFGEPALSTAADVGLPGDADDLARRCPPADLPRLAAALIRVGREGDDVRERLRDGTP